MRNLCKDCGGDGTQGGFCREIDSDARDSVELLGSIKACQIA